MLVLWVLQVAVVAAQEVPPPQQEAIASAEEEAVAPAAELPVSSCAAPADAEGSIDLMDAPPGDLGSAITLLFPTRPGRDLVLLNCMTCHSFVRIALARKTEEQWIGDWRRRHRPRVSGLSDADFTLLFNYLVENFNPDRAEPQLPQWLLNLGR